MEITLNAIECKAIEQSIRSVGQYVAEQGIGDRAIKDLQKEEVLGLIAKCVRAHQKELHDLVDADGPAVSA